MITEDFKSTSAYEKGFLPGDEVDYRHNHFMNTYIVDEKGIGRNSIDRKSTIDFSGQAGDYTLDKRRSEEVVTQTKQDGGPSSYYDPPFKDWITVNDMVDYYAEKKWKHLSWIFKDILKAVTRWGDKQGTSQEYDANKIIYYGCRLLMSIKSKEAVRAYLQRLLNDKQFGG
jgi:hypothetical protein